MAVAVAHHAADYRFAELVQVAALAEGGHGTAQTVRLAGTETGGDHHQLDHLLLENGNAQGARQHFLYARIRVLDLFLSMAAAQVGMHHVALDRSGAHDRHFDHQVVKGFRS